MWSRSHPQRVCPAWKICKMWKVQAAICNLRREHPRRRRFDSKNSSYYRTSQYYRSTSSCVGERAVVEIDVENNRDVRGTNWGGDKLFDHHYVGFMGSGQRLFFHVVLRPLHWRWHDYFHAKREQKKDDLVRTEFVARGWDLHQRYSWIDESKTLEERSFNRGLFRYL